MSASIRFAFTKPTALATNASRGAHARERKHVAATLADDPWHELEVCMFVVVIAGEDNGEVEGTPSHAVVSPCCNLPMVPVMSIAHLHCLMAGLHITRLGPR